MLYPQLDDLVIETLSTSGHPIGSFKFSDCTVIPARMTLNSVIWFSEMHPSVYLFIFPFWNHFSSTNNFSIFKRLHPYFLFYHVSGLYLHQRSLSGKLVKKRIVQHDASCRWPTSKSTISFSRCWPDCAKYVSATLGISELFSQWSYTAAFRFFSFFFFLTD